jgi:membrane protease subunit (stomatin/prohibitin family)
VLTYLKNWDKLFESPFKSDVYFFSTRQQLDQKWGTPQPVTIRDKDSAPCACAPSATTASAWPTPAFHTEISGTRERYGVADLDGQLRGLVLQNISHAIAASGVPFLDLAANQQRFAQALSQQLGPEFERLGLKLDSLTVQNVSLPEELQKILDQKIGMGMVGATWASSCSTRRRRPSRAWPRARPAAAWPAMGLGAGVALGQVLAQNLQAGLQGGAAAPALPPAAVARSSRRDHGHAGEAGRSQGQGHPDRRRVRRQEGRAAEEARLRRRARLDVTERSYPRCPGCGAPVEFRSAQSTHAVCPYCQSTVLRQGEVLSRIGAWPSCSTTTARCSSGARALRQPGLHADRPPAVQGAGRRLDRVDRLFEDGSQAS